MSSPGETAEASATPTRSQWLAVRVVLACGLLALALAAIGILLQRAPRRSGTNLTADVGYVVPLAPASRLCEPGELLPGDTGALKLNVAPASGVVLPALDITINGPDGRLATGNLAAGARPGTVIVPTTDVPHTIGNATVCVGNAGPVAVKFGGSVPDQAFVIEDGGKPMLGRLRIEYMRPRSESWLQLLPTIAYRFSLAKSDIVRHWEAGAVLILMAFAIALAVRTLIRDERTQ